MLQEQIAQQYQNLAGLTTLGQRSAAGQGAAGMETAGTIGNLLGQRGAALAGGQLAKGSVARTAFGDILDIAGTVSGFMGGGQKKGGF
jgi:hypothetical protein